MDEIVKQCAGDLFACFQTQGTYELYAEEVPEWIEVTSDKILAYRDEIIVYEFDRHSTTGVCYFHTYPTSESRLAWAAAQTVNYLYGLRGNEFKKFIAGLHDCGVIWTV